MKDRYGRARQAQAQVVLSPVVEYEIERGLARRHAARLALLFEEFRGELAYRAFERSTWLKAAELWAFSRHRGFPLPDADLLIAAQALDLGAALVTNNTRHFAIFAEFGLKLEDWTLP